MSRIVKLAAALALVVPLAALAQTQNLQRRAEGLPAGLALPGATTAGGEEPAAMSVNPAAVGFVEELTLQYFHEGRRDTRQAADGFYLALPVSAIVPALSMEWVRPARGDGPRFRRTSFGFALSGGQMASLAVAGSWYASPDRDVDRLFGLDAGLTLRPWRHLSLAFAALDMSARLAGRRLPIRYDFGAATRLLGDALTLSADLLTDDQARGDLTVRAGVVGAGLELGRGLALAGQVQFPLHAGLTGAAGATFAQLAVTYNAAHAGVTVAGGSGDRADDTWLAGLRLSTQRYRSRSPLAGRIPDIDLSKALKRPRSILGGPRDAFGALLGRLAEAREDDAVPAVLLRIDDLPVGHGRADELRREIVALRARKPVVVYLTGGGLKEYWIASAATQVLAPPASDLLVNGLSTTTPFLREGLARLGVGFDVVAAGRYKNAPDPLVRGDMSAPQREVGESVLGDVFDRQVKGIAEARGLTEARVRELVDVGVFTTDAAVWPDELEQAASRLAGRKASLAASWDRSSPRGAQRWGPRRAIAVVRVEGTIAQGKSRSEPLGTGGIAGAETIAALVKEAAEDREVVAIVLRIDSPGGDGLASDLIWREVMQARRKGKPVVAWMGDLAASGGYLVAVAADAIVAEPSTLTGSIGVFTVKPDVSGLLKKLGVHTVTLKRGEHADAMSVLRPWTEEERKAAERQILAFYAVFLSRVADGRHLQRNAVEDVAGGRVWTGAQALERGLVDSLGTFEEALALAATRAGYGAEPDLEVRAFEPPRPLIDLGGLLGASDSAWTRAFAAIPELRTAALLGELGPVLALPTSWLDGAFAPPPARP